MSSYILDILGREPDVTQLYKESWSLNQIYNLNSIYLETKGNLGSFVKLFTLSQEAGINAEHVKCIATWQRI